MEQSRQRTVQLYSERLTDFCKDNTLYLELLKDHVEELDKLKKHDAFLKESKVDSDAHRLSKAADPSNLAVMFTRVDPADEKLFKLPARTGEYEDRASTYQKTENPFCYLCTTIEQHRKHMMKTEKKIHGKPRIPYEAPAPFVAPKPPPQKPESRDCLFKVTVRTGTDIKAACPVPVYISLLGEKDELSRVRLAKKFGSLAFFFDSGSTEVFHLRGPRIGRLEQLTLSMDDEAEVVKSQHPQQKQKRHRWLVESVTVKDYSLGVEYQFLIDSWMRSGESRRSGRRRRDTLRVAPSSAVKCSDSSGRGVLVTTHTGRKATSGTDCRVYISLLGQAGCGGRHELRQPSEANRIFQAGGKDEFELHVEDFGADLKGIRLELDTLNMRPEDMSDRRSIKPGRDSRTLDSSKTWFVDQVIVKDIKTGQKWLFTISDWLNEDNPSKEFWTVKDVKDGLEGAIYSQKTMYQVVTKTGNKDFAGTDSNIYLSLFDKQNRRCDIVLRDDEDKSKFEKGKTDTISETARVIDTPERLKVSISGAGMAPDWQMDGIVVTKYLVIEEIVQYLQRLQFSNKMPSGLTQEKGKILFDGADGDKKRKKQKGLKEKEIGKQRKQPDWEQKDRKDKRDKRDKRDKQDKKKKDKKKSSRDDRDAHVFGRGRRSSSLQLSSDASDSSDDDQSSEASSSDTADSVKSHDDFDPGHGTVKLPYAVQVSFKPRSKEDAWLKKDKTVELRAGDSKTLFRELRLRSDNENFERIRQEMLEKQREEELKAKRLREKNEKKKKQQQEAKRAAAKRSGSKRSKSGGRTASSDSSSSSSSSDGRSAARKAADKRRPLGQAAAARKKSLVRDSSSDSESSHNAFGKKSVKTTADKKKADKKLPPEKRLAAALEDRRSTIKAADDGRKLRGAAPDAKEVRGGTSSLRSSTRSPRSGVPPEPGRGLDRVDFDKGRSRDSLDLDRDRGRTDADKVRGRLDLDKGQNRSPRDLGRGRLDLDKDQDRSPLDLDRGRGRLDLDRGRGRVDLDKGQSRSPRDLGRGRLDLDKDQNRSPLDLDRGRGRLDLDKDQNRSPLDLDRGRGRLDLDKGQSRSPRDLGRGRLDLDKDQNRSPLDLDRGRGHLDLDRGRGRLDLDKGQSRSPRDLGRGRLDLDKDQNRSPLDLDRGRGHLDLDRGRGRLDLDKGHDRLDLDRGRGRLDPDRRGSAAAAAAAPLDNPRILVTATDGRAVDSGVARGSGRVRQRSFNLD